MISLLEATAATNPLGGGSFLWVMVIYIVVIGGAMYFISYRPQKKQQREMQALLDSLEVGDSVLTTSGFYGVVIDIKDEIVIVEFGSNKNCRIPMKKTAITEVEKAGGQEN
ncbi:MAG: preprotein translocase subunit YajC [Lachnospiraceae bacterium]|nr:preprotein translocase subunit YajC [Lachnospiraceae bacterium]